MKRIKLVLAVAAAMVALLVAMSPAHAIIDSGKGLTTATEAGVGNPNEKAFVATREAPPAIGNPDVMPAALVRARPS